MIQIPGLQVIGQRAGKKLLVRQDSLRFANFNMDIVQEAGAPVGQYEEGSMFFNAEDQKQYFVANYKYAHTPSLLWLKCNAIISNLLQDFSTGQHVTTTSTSTTIIDAGKYKKALNFDGVNDKLVIDDALGLAINTDWCVSFWINLPVEPSVDEDRAYIFERYVDATHWFKIIMEYHSASRDTFPAIEWQDGGAITLISSNRDYTETDTGKWVHFLLSHNASGNEVLIHKNGSSTGNAASGIIPNISFGTENYEVGRSQSDSNFGDFVIKLDDIKIWQKRRTGSKVKIDSLNLDELHWASYQGSVVE